MVTIRNANEIILGLIDYFRLVQPDLDTKPGTVARDLFIDAPASQMALIYEELAGISNLQSIRLAAGSDLDKLAKNFGITRKAATPSNGVALLTFNSADAPFAINVGDLVISGNGLTFQVTTGTSITPSAANTYLATATKFKNDLDLVGIQDQYAIQVFVQCQTPGSIGNIGKYYLNRSNTSGINNATNTNNFSGGSDQESDAVFRNRILALFNGSSVGTALGYGSVALSTNNVVDAVVIEPGDPLMTRDGTVVKTDSNGNKTIISEGQGGKVDVIILGQNLLQTTDSYIYQDKSNSNDPTNSKNDVILGQISGDENKTINRRRIDNINSGVLPSQPVDSIVSVTGSLSGPNFIAKSVDSLGRISGNYELVKDSGVYAGSPWGFDKIKWISSKISNFSQDLIKNQFNGQDALSYTDVLKISNAQQNISISNENSIVTSDRSIIQLLHTPALNVTRVFNVNTGERYLISNQNPDGTGTINYTGRIKISGNTLPSTTDILQVDYSWVFSFDQYSDYDGKSLNDNLRQSIDTVDWGYCSQIKNEEILFSQQSNIFAGKTSHPISSIIYCNAFNKLDGVVYEVSSGINIGRKAINLNYLLSPISTIENIFLKNTRTEAYVTAENNGSFSNKGLGGTPAIFSATIILPTDTPAIVNQKVSVIFNSQDTYSINTSTGSFSGNTVNIPASNINIATSQIYLNVSYIANVPSLFPSSATSLLPVSRVSNGYYSSNLGFSNNSNFNNLIRESKVIQKNNSGKYYVELDIATDIFSSPEILAVIRINDGSILWDSINAGTISSNISNNKYQLIFSNYNSPLENQQTIVFYYTKDNSRYQPISYSNQVIKSEESIVQAGPDQRLYVDLVKYTDTSGPLKLQVFDPVYQTLVEEALDGYLQVNPSNPQQIIVSSSTAPFDLIKGITNFKLKVYDGYHFNNNGVFDIISIDTVTNKITAEINLNNIKPSQISITRLSDNKEIWNNTGAIDIVNNKLIIPSFNNPVLFDKVFINYFIYNNLRNSPARILSSVSDQNASKGSISISGATISKIEDVVLTSLNSGLTVDLTEAVVKGLGYSSISSLPASLKLVRIVKLQKVETSGNSNEVLNTIVDYDLKNCQVKDNSYYVDELIENYSLNRFTIVLPPTTKNTSDTSQEPYLPKIGEKLKTTIYVVNSSDSENLSYSAPGILYTNKKFSLIDKIYVSSGFNSTSSSSLSLNPINQPSINSRYKVFYDYTAPKTNERITINYDFNQTISDVTFNIETNRPINADVIVKEATPILVDVTMNIVILPAYVTSSTTVAQNVKSALIGSINLNSLGGVLDASDLINTAYSISGVDRARITYFNKDGSIGQALSLTAQKNEYFAANSVIVNVETR